MAPSYRSSKGSSGYFSKAAIKTTLVLFLGATPATLAFLGSGGAGIARTNGVKQCRPRSCGRVAPMAAAPLESPPASKKKRKKTSPGSDVKFGGRVTKAVAVEASDSAAKELEEDVRKSARWGVAPPPLPKLGGVVGNPLAAVKGSVSAVGKGVTAAKDALYGAADAAGSLAELTQKQLDSGKGEDARHASQAGSDDNAYLCCAVLCCAVPCGVLVQIGLPRTDFVGTTLY